MASLPNSNTANTAAAITVAIATATATAATAAATAATAAATATTTAATAATAAATAVTAAEAAATVVDICNDPLISDCILAIAAIGDIDEIYEIYEEIIKAFTAWEKIKDIEGSKDLQIDLLIEEAGYSDFERKDRESLHAIKWNMLSFIRWDLQFMFLDMYGDDLHHQSPNLLTHNWNCTHCSSSNLSTHDMCNKCGSKK